MLAGMLDESERASGFGELPFLPNVHLGLLPWTGSLWRVGPGRGNPQHSVQLHRGRVRRFWQGVFADTKAHRPTAEIAKNTLQQPTNHMQKCHGSHMHAKTYLVRYLAKTCNKFKHIDIGAYATTKNTLSIPPDTKSRTRRPQSVIPTDGQILASNHTPLLDTPALHNSNTVHDLGHANHKQTNNLSVTGPNLTALAQTTPTSNPTTMTNKTAVVSILPYPVNPDMSMVPNEDPPVLSSENQNQVITTVKEQINTISFFVKWRRLTATRTTLLPSLSAKHSRITLLR